MGKAWLYDLSGLGEGRYMGCCSTIVQEVGHPCWLNSLFFSEKPSIKQIRGCLMHYKSVLTATLCNLPILKNKGRNLSPKTLFSCHHYILESAGNVGSKYGLNCSRDNNHILIHLSFMVIIDVLSFLFFVFQQSSRRILYKEAWNSACPSVFLSAGWLSKNRSEQDKRSQQRKD